ncbi:MAG: aminotransferase class I/II-fold pyridoxal phosphate-dependent enzyme [Ignavibacteriaceae bacterium]|nr:aminotransferase class I/II-fold pyridoxal phosphate-dependent enzyme [Ignavibacteriaceae bacterium]
MKTDSKLPSIGTSIFAVMSKMANDYNAINLSQGFPDFNCNEELRNLVSDYMNRGFNQYAPMPGVLKLRQKISEKTLKVNHRYYDPENEITITAGATQALFSAISALTGKDDEVIIFEPAYDSYSPVVLLNGGRPVYIKLKGNDFRIDWDEVADSITEKTKLIIINSPHNPTGSVINETDIRNLETIIENKNIFVISDEVYEHIVFDNKKHLSLASSELLYQRSFIISSFGKTYHTTGWKIGYANAPGYLMDEFRKIHQFIVFAVNTPIQMAYADYIEDEKNYLSLNDFYQEKRDYFLENIKDSRFRFKPAEGTYFQILDYSDISELDDYTFTERLTKESGVATIPLSPFFSGLNDLKLIRICFAKRNEILKSSADILNRI